MRSGLSARRRRWHRLVGTELLNQLRVACAARRSHEPAPQPVPVAAAGYSVSTTLARSATVRPPFRACACSGVDGRRHARADRRARPRMPGSRHTHASLARRRKNGRRPPSRTEAPFGHVCVRRCVRACMRRCSCAHAWTYVVCASNHTCTHGRGPWQPARVPHVAP